MVESSDTGPQEGAEPQLPTDGAAEAVDFSTQLERVINAYLVPDSNPVDELAKLDSLYNEAGASADSFVEGTAKQLLEDSSAFDNMNFQSSLLTGGSKFFGAVLRKMGELVAEDPELAESAALPVKIRLVEHYRRAFDRAKKNGEMEEMKEMEEKMNEFATEVEDILRDRVVADETLALGQLAKVRYEQSMFAFGEQDFEVSMKVGGESVDLCERAGDTYGALAARGNTAGLCRYTLVRERGDHPDNERLLSEGREMLIADLARVQLELRRLEAGTPAHQNFTRVEMNNVAHLMHIADLQGQLEAARTAMSILERNPVFQSAFDPAHPGDYAHAQEWIRVYPEIIERLEQL